MQHFLNTVEWLSINNGTPCCADRDVGAGHARDFRYDENTVVAGKARSYPGNSHYYKLHPVKPLGKAGRPSPGKNQA